MSRRLEPDFRKQLAQRPDARFDAIVVAAHGVEELRGCLPPEITVRREFKLVPSLEVRGPGAALLTLAEEQEVRSIEPVRTVTST
jgi:hypothetical protein